MARDGFGFGVNFRGRYRFNARQTGFAFTDFLLGLPSDVTDQVTNRGPLDGHSDDIAAFVQDDWKVSEKITVFLGLRYEVIGAWHEKGGAARELLARRRRPPRRAVGRRSPHSSRPG